MTRLTAKSQSVSRLRNDGSSLEANTLEIMRLFPGSHVEHQKKLAGKKVDHFCVLSTGFMPPFRIAIECKDWHRPLTRAQVALVVADYLPLLEQHLIDQFLLVTRCGISPDARAIFDGRRLQHLTFADLTDKVFDPTPLVDDMARQYSADGLDSYYIPQTLFAPNLKLASEQFDLLYNDFIEFAFEVKAVSLSVAKTLWFQYAADASKDVIASYDDELFCEVIDSRKLTRPTSGESMLLEWVRDDSLCEGLALLGSYGTGKSSFARRMAYLCAVAYRNDKTSRIPFLIELKEFGSHQDIRGLVTHELVNRHRVPNGSFELFQSLNAAGRFFIILDGFDEMKQGMTTDALLYNFHQLATLFTGRSKILLCGRPTIFESHSEQSKILTGDLQLGGNKGKYVPVTIAPFTLSEVADFLVRYVKQTNPLSLDKTQHFVSELIVEAKSNNELASLVSRPVHLPMLAAVIPRADVRPGDLRRADLYREFIDAIIERELFKRPREFQQAYPVQAR